MANAHGAGRPGDRHAAWSARLGRLALLARRLALGDVEPLNNARAPSLRRLAALALAVTLCLGGLLLVAPLGGTSQNVSPLARAWPWAFAPAHLLFPRLPLRLSMQPEHGRGTWPAAVFTALLVIAAAFAGLAVWRCRYEQGSRLRHLALVLGGALVMGATLIPLPSMPSDDVFSYSIYGRIAALHHADPLISTPAQFPHDPFLSFVYWVDVRSVYGPIWLLTSAGVTQLAQALGGALATYVLLFKLLALACHLVNTALIWAILTRLAPRRRLLGTLLYAWNPLCLLEFAASGHNDALMLTFLLLGVLCLTYRWEVPALVAFGLAIATKYVPLALLPLYLFAVVRPLLARTFSLPSLRAVALAPVPFPSSSSDRPWGASWRDLISPAAIMRLPRTAARSLRASVDSATARASLRAAGWEAGWRLAVVLAVVVALTLPYWAGLGTLKSVLYSPPAERLDNSLLEAIAWPLRWLSQALFGLSPTAAMAAVEGMLKVGGLLAFAILWLREFRRARGLTGTLAAWAWVLFWYVVVASGWFWPWYVTWLVAIVALVPWSELSVATLLLAGGVLTLYAFRPLTAAPLYGYRALFAFGPAVVYLLAIAWRRRQSRARVRSDDPALDGAEVSELAGAALTAVDLLQRESAPTGR